MNNEYINTMVSLLKASTYINLPETNKVSKLNFPDIVKQIIEDTKADTGFKDMHKEPIKINNELSLTAKGKFSKELEELWKLSPPHDEEVRENCISFNGTVIWSQKHGAWELTTAAIGIAVQQNLASLLRNYDVEVV